MGDAITAAMQNEVVDVIGRSPLKLLIALMERASIVISPDAGPAHMANITQTPVIALHAATDSRRSGPYSSLDWCVDRFPEAAQAFLNKDAAQLKWGTKIERDGVMELISSEDVIAQLHKLANHLQLTNGK